MTFEEVKKLRDDTYIMHTFKRKPVCFVEGEGVTVKDEEGKEYLESCSRVSGLTVSGALPSACCRGSSVAEQAQKLIHVSNLLLYREAWRSRPSSFRRWLTNAYPRSSVLLGRPSSRTPGRRPTNARSSFARLWAKKESSGGHIILVLERKLPWSYACNACRYGTA